MTHHVLLNNVDHGNLRVVTARSAGLGDDVMYTPTFPLEFRNLQAHYPIVFRKESATGRFQPVALFGFEEGENLFLLDDGWDAPYVPLTIERQPFLIGFQQRREDGTARKPVVHVDLDSPRISTTEGEALFLEYGGVSDYLKRITSVLHTIHEGLESNRAFADTLLELDLLESFVLDVELEDRSQHRLIGFYTINEERLSGLSGEALAGLNESGWLLPVYMAVASLSNLRSLIERRRRRREGSARG